MNNNIIDLYYFSGTGNTLLAVKKMAEVFEKHKKEVNLFKIEKSNPETINQEHVIGIAVPVAAQGTYYFIWEFIKKLPDVKGTKIFFLDTLANFSGGIIGSVRKILAKKNFECIGAKEIIMPSNLVPFPILDDEKIEQIRKKGIREVEKYALSILNGKSKWERVPLLSDLMSLFSRCSIGWKIANAIFQFKIKKEKCTKCGICAKICPVENITFDTDGFPVFGKECYFCMRCYAFCKNKAIYMPICKTLKRYKSVEITEIL